MQQQRMKKVLQAMEEGNMDRLIISDSPSIYYLTDQWIHSQERMLTLVLCPGKEPVLIINELFPLPEDPDLRVIRYKDTDNPIDTVNDFIKGGKTIGIDKNWPSRFLIALMKGSPKLIFENGSYIVDQIRRVKEPEEIEKMKTASAINDKAMKKLIGEIPRGYTEKEATRRLGEIYEELGADGFSFDPIVAYGKNGANPHHTPGDERLKEGDSILIDIGCYKDSYASDMTRTVFYKKMSDKQKEIYRIVQQANQAAIHAVRPGIKFSEIDQAARDYIEKKGYGEYFTHRTGHSIGIEVHEYGDVSASNSEKIQEGMIFSIEPGIYLPGNFGVRIEDLVQVTDQGAEVLNLITKNPVIVG